MSTHMVPEYVAALGGIGPSITRKINDSREELAGPSENPNVPELERAIAALAKENALLTEAVSRLAAISTYGFAAQAGATLPEDLQEYANRAIADIRAEFGF